jgi:hypothetical protein
MLSETQIIPPVRRRRESEDFDVLVPLRVIARELGKKPRTVVFWATKGTLGFSLVKLNGRYHGSRQALEERKRALLQAEGR